MKRKWEYKDLGKPSEDAQAPEDVEKVCEDWQRLERGERMSFTSEEINGLIDEAQQAAFEQPGEKLGWRSVVSQEDEEFNAESKEGSIAEDSHKEQDFEKTIEDGSKAQTRLGSQAFHKKLHFLVKERLSGAGAGFTVGELGAWVDGETGTITAKPAKVAGYIKLALEVLGRGQASQRELQVVGGGFVYVAMFRRPLLASLNQIWISIVEAPAKSPHARFWLRREVLAEIARFIGLCPLSFINIRSPFDEMVTASDASVDGGGICKSSGVTPYGHAAGLSTVRGDIPEEVEFTQVLSIGLFDGIGALRVALDVLKVPVAGHISVEKNDEARRVVEANFPDSQCIDDVESVDDAMVHNWALQFSQVGLVLLGSGPPCQGVSGLNSDRKGAMRDIRSKLFTHVPRVEALCRKHFPWAQVHSLTENVASMDKGDCQMMNAEFDSQPWFIDANGISLAHRPRLYWISWEVQEGPGVEIYWGSDGQLPICGEIRLYAEVEEKSFLEPGWKRQGEKALPTFTTSRPSPVPLRRPAGLKDCNDEELSRWRAHDHRFPPYQYKACNCLVDAKGSLRTPNSKEREAEGLVIPHKKDDMDSLVSDYLEYMWAQGLERFQESQVGERNDRDRDPRCRGRHV
eukprot:s1207_g12.t1